MQNKICILLASYNGAKYLSIQIDSILNQSYSNWEIFISDDGSSDGTVAIIEDYCRLDNRIHVVNEELIKQGACQNFGNLMKRALKEQWDFVMFADQDDYWHENKIELSLDAMLNTVDFDKQPTLVYTDFVFAGDDLNPLKKETDKGTAKWKEASLPRLLAQNNIYGCTMMANRLLIEKSSPVPICAENHDYWIALVAASLGQIVHVKKRTMLYRQHSNNVSGHYTNNSLINRIRRYTVKKEYLKSIMVGRFKMAREMNDCFANELQETDKALLSVYSEFEHLYKYERVLFCLKKGIQKDSFLQNIAFYYSLIRI